MPNSRATPHIARRGAAATYLRCALLCGLSLVIVAGCRSLPNNQRPHAAFSYSLAEEHVPTVLTLDASGSFNPDGEIVSYLWSVGGAHHGGEVVSVPLATAGEQQIRLIVTDDRGAHATATTSFWLDLAPAAISGPLPESLALEALVGQTVAGQLEFSNAGGERLVVAVSTDVGWLTASPASATVESGESRSLSVNATCESAGAHQGTVALATSDPLRGTVEVSITLDCTAPSSPTSEFHIAMLFSGSDFTPARQQVFLAAAERWSEVIVGDLPNVAVTQQHINNCALSGTFANPGVVDDLLVLATIRAIDGPGNILGRAGVCYRRSGATGLPVMGFMELDVADVVTLENQDRLFGVVLHEIGHILDLNQQGWNRLGLLAFNDTSCGASTDIWFTGTNASNEWLAVGGGAPLPVEADGGAGTKCSHWDEVALGSELMTGWASGGMELSKVTVGALNDLGYLVDYTATDAYTPPALGQASTDAFHLEEILFPELGTIDPIDDSGSGTTR